MAIEITSERREARRLPRLLKARRGAEGSERGKRTRDWPRRLRLIGVVALVSCAAVVASLVYCYLGAAETIDRRLASGYLTSRAGLYAAPRVLRAGQNFSRERLVETLRRAGYVEQSASDVWSGAFRVNAEGAVEISPRRTTGAEERAAAEAATEGFTPEVVRVAFDRRGRIADITGDGVTLDAFALEPEALTNDAATKTGTRATLAYADIPPVLASAIRAIEDRRFFEHHGLDITGIGRALLSWTGDTGRGASAPERQGGSTITQQLVKNTYLTPERTLSRKFNEALLAAALERRLSKEDIFALYCNEIYLGQRGAFAVRGVKQAARVYFGKELRDLSLGEAAIIAGMIQSPARYAPDRRAEDSRARRNAVLAAMLRDDSITAEQARAASNEAITVAPVDPSARATAPYFVDYVNRAIEAQLHTGGADELPLRVYTTIDLDLQQLAEQAVARQLAQLEKSYKSGDARPQAALVALDPNTGHVLAMVGGKNYAESQLNRATDARRQPGSVFKPIVYAAALESGISPARLFTDAPRAFAFDRHSPAYRPANYGGGYSMRDVTMRTALTKSLNVVTVDLAMQAGLPRVAALAETFGLPKVPAYPSLALGTAEATPLEIASAYTAFANGGTRTRASSVTRAVDGNGMRLFEEFLPSSAQVVNPSTAYMITDMLTNVVAEGTARAARGMLKLSAVAGKTGTSRDGWFVGYTPQLVCVVWIGFDDNRQLGLTGADSALPVWSEFMRGALELRPELGGAAFLRPEGVASVEIDPATGQLASSFCPERERIAVTHALAPTSECLTHQPLLPLLAANDAPQPAPQLTVVVPNDAARADAANSSRARDARGHSAPVVLPAPSIQTTRIEQSRSGRARLTNDPQVVSGRAAQH